MFFTLLPMKDLPEVCSDPRTGRLRLALGEVPSGGETESALAQCVECSLRSLLHRIHHLLCCVICGNLRISRIMDLSAEP